MWRSRTEPGGETHRRTLLVRGKLAAVVLLAAAALAALTLRWFVFPPQDKPDRADAVVVFAGGAGTERIDTAMALLKRDVAPVLVLNQSTNPWYYEPGSPDLCENLSVDFEVICVKASPNSTRGEAAMFGDLAAERGWDSIVLVTSSLHLHRAELWLDRCVDASIQRVGADTPTSMGQVLHELAGTLHAAVLDRSCPTHQGTVTGGSAPSDGS